MQPLAAWEPTARRAQTRKVWLNSAIAALILVICGLTLPAHAKYASYVIDADTGEVLHGLNEETRNYPASLTKMMTLYMMFDRLKTGKWSLSTDLKVSRRAARQPASRLGLRAGSTITVKQAILALVTKSANDVATVVAENIAGRERNFALKMTAKARSLGMSKTTFRNASGLPHRAQLSTAKDMSILARSLLRDFPEYYHYFSTKSFSFDGRTHSNHNKLLKTYAGTDGFKTGYIRASGFNLVASATRDGRRIIGVVFGGRSSGHRNRHMTNLLDKGFSLLAKRHGTQQLIAKAPVRETKTASLSPAGASTRSVWGVQVGAFSQVSQAQAAATKAIGKAPSYLADGQIRIVPLKKRNGSILHRARIVGISKRDAYRTCRILRDCMELKTDVNAEVAERVD
ncbi:MAG: D-alanyl-D-alanine carboxypeptidase [Rhodospirillales bacterium]|nr:D-alanyl-D-alanine carboxypeptidase [Rhodospirillales bacterium]MBO6786550.1 D-alanyl-D-alanine carboxypeptidase [Rhodospirillales bacterium]